MSKHTLIIHLTRISPTHHRFAYRVDGVEKEALEFETKTFLFHDLLHFAVETAAGLEHSFYGLLIEGKTYTSLTESPMSATTISNEIGMTERVVGGLTGVIKQGADPDAFLAMMKNLLDAYNEPMPAYLTVDFVEEVKERMRKLLGEWNATKFGDSMELKFEV